MLIINQEHIKLETNKVQNKFNVLIQVLCSSISANAMAPLLPTLLAIIFHI